MQIRTIAIIAEGIPEAKTRQLNRKAKELEITIIGPATVSTHETHAYFFPKPSQNLFVERLAPKTYLNNITRGEKVLLHVLSVSVLIFVS